jgi:hypothetical protein
MTSATLLVVKVGSEMESIAINIYTDFKSIYLQTNLTNMYRLLACMQNLAATIVVAMHSPTQTVEIGCLMHLKILGILYTYLNSYMCTVLHPTLL